MTPILPLIFAHFLSDFPLQPGALVRYKLSRFRGVVLHGAVHFVTSAALLFPFWNETKIFSGVGIIFIWHVIVDQTKITLSKKTGVNPVLLFFLDQILHLGMITLVSFYVIGPMPGAYPFPQEIFWYALILTLCTYTYDITRWTIIKNTPTYVRDYKMMLRNGTIVTIAFTIYWMMR